MTKPMTSKNSILFNHPKGLLILFLTEMWERMSYYGMRGILILFMTAGITDNPGLNLSNGNANAIYGIYTGMVYLLCLPGGWIADNLLGYQKSVIFGAIIITLGHLILSIPIHQTFIFGLAFVAIGTGLLKPNISSIVGQLYSKEDPRRDSGFTIFYMAINIGSILGFTICGWLGERIGWHWGFGAAGFGMLLGLIQFLSFRSWLGEVGKHPIELSKDKKSNYIYAVISTFILSLALVGTAALGYWSINPVYFAERFRDFLVFVSVAYFVYLLFIADITQAERQNVILLLILFIGAAAFWSGFDQSAGSFTIFTRDYVDLTFNSFVMPVSWLQQANPIFIVIFAPFFASFWLFLGSRGLNPNIPLKFALGLLFMALGFIVMVFAVNLATKTGSAHVQWLLITYLLHTFGELTISPVGLSAFSKYSPKKYMGQMMGVWFLAASLGGVIAGLIGGNATSSGLVSINPTFKTLIYYYLILAVILGAIGIYLKKKPEH